MAHKSIKSKSLSSHQVAAGFVFDFKLYNFRLANFATYSRQFLQHAPPQGLDCAAGAVGEARMGAPQRMDLR